MMDYQDEKTIFIQQQLEQGKTRTEIAHSFNQHWKSIDMHMRRRGFRWDRKNQIYFLQEKQISPTKAQAILQSLATKNPNFKKIARQHGFQTVEAMGHYMKEQGYVWHPELQNYYYTSTPGNTNQHLALNESTLIQFLLANQQTLTNVLTTAALSSNTLITNEITITLTASLYETLLRKCADNQLTPQTIIELALTEYLAVNLVKSN
ncbi:hypothetical protein [Metasolibacillus meyeri]|uniref:hypothetical protein n=1 Tax=Metasolibacillus meyeri TaxID=1071052 RepID=UPI000D2FA4CC|nr:hypothetical protein [Metasolibacillus meyeri]